MDKLLKIKQASIKQIQKQAAYLTKITKIIFKITNF